MSKGKPTPLLAIKNLLFKWGNLSFFTHSHLFSVQYLSPQVQLQVISLSHPNNFQEKTL